MEESRSLEDEPVAEAVAEVVPEVESVAEVAPELAAEVAAEVESVAEVAPEVAPEVAAEVESVAEVAAEVAAELAAELVAEVAVEPQDDKTPTVEVFKDYFTDYVNILNAEKRNESLSKVSNLEKKPINSFTKFAFYNNSNKFKESMKMKMI
jgi:hypothetical protein